MTMHYEVKKEIVREGKRQKEEQHISCLITGIDFTVLLPRHSELPQHKKNHYKFHFCQQHPLSRIDEALSFASLSSIELREFDESLIAGAILSIFHHWNIREDKMSAKEANLILQYAPLPILYSSLHFLSSINARIAKHIPHISLEGTNTGTLGTWLWAARSALDLPIASQIEKKPTIKAKGILVHSVESETRTQARALLSTLKTIIAPKLYTILSASIPGNTLATMSDALRTNLIKGLETYIEIEPASSSFIKILKDTKNNASVQERILTTQLDSYERFSTSYQPDSILIPAKKTMKEILAEKIAEKMVEKTGNIASVKESPEASSMISPITTPTMPVVEPRRIDIFNNLLLDLNDEIEEEAEEQQKNEEQKSVGYEDIEEPDSDAPSDLDPSYDLSLESEPSLFDQDYIPEIESTFNIKDIGEDGNENDGIQ